MRTAPYSSRRGTVVASIRCMEEAMIWGKVHNYKIDLYNPLEPERMHKMG